MTIVFEERLSDSPYVRSVTRGYMAAAGTTVRPAECCWHLIVTRYQGVQRIVVVGALELSGQISYPEGVEGLWIRFKPGAFMPHLPPNRFCGQEQALPEGAGNAFWLNSQVWQVPDFDNADTFIDHLVRGGVLTADPLVTSALSDEALDSPDRTVRHRVQRATGLSQSRIRQIERAQQAATLLAQGVPILDAVDQLGYYDQPHLTRSLKRFTGRTPGEVFVRSCQPE
jgi:AraC-like DNA-binding protein